MKEININTNNVIHFRHTEELSVFDQNNKTNSYGMFTCIVRNGVHYLIMDSVLTRLILKPNNLL